MRTLPQRMKDLQMMTLFLAAKKCVNMHVDEDAFEKLYDEYVKIIKLCSDLEDIDLDELNMN